MEVSRRRVCWCGSSEYELLVDIPYGHFFNKEQYSHKIGICSNCNSVLCYSDISENDLIEFYSNNSLYADYSLDSFETNANSKKAIRQYKFVQDFLGENHSVIDVGCASGYTLYEYKKHNHKCYGIDTNQSAIKVAKQKYNLEIENGFIFDIKNKFVNTKFDHISLSHVLEHLLNPKECLVELRSVISDSGTIFIETPCLEVFKDSPGEPYGHFCAEHLNFFTKQSISQLLNMSGFEVLKVEIVDNDLVTMPFYPVVCVVARPVKVMSNIQFTKDLAGKDKAIEYIKLTTQEIERIKARLRAIKLKYKNIAIWGIGSHTSRLSALGVFSEINPECFIDNGSSRPKSYLDKPVYEISKLPDSVQVVVLSSYSSIQSMINQFNTLKSQKEVLTLYDQWPT